MCRLCSREGTSSYVELVHRLLGRPAGLVLQIAIVAFGVGMGPCLAAFDWHSCALAWSCHCMVQGSGLKAGQGKLILKAIGRQGCSVLDQGIVP